MTHSKVGKWLNLFGVGGETRGVHLYSTALEPVCKNEKILNLDQGSRKCLFAWDKMCRFTPVFSNYKLSKIPNINSWPPLTTCICPLTLQMSSIFGGYLVMQEVTKDYNRGHQLPAWSPQLLMDICPHQTTSQNQCTACSFSHTMSLLNFLKSKAIIFLHQSTLILHSVSHMAKFLISYH